MMFTWLFTVPQPPIQPPSSNLAIFAIVLSALATLFGGGTFWFVRDTRRKIKAEAGVLEVEPEVLLSDATMRAFDSIEKRLRAEEAKSVRLEEKNERLEGHVRALEDELREHGITPPKWPPLKVVDDV